MSRPAFEDAVLPPPELINQPMAPKLILFHGMQKGDRLFRLNGALLLASLDDRDQRRVHGYIINNPAPMRLGEAACAVDMPEAYRFKQILDGTMEGFEEPSSQQSLIILVSKNIFMLLNPETIFGDFGTYELDNPEDASDVLNELSVRKHQFLAIAGQCVIERGDLVGALAQGTAIMIDPDPAIVFNESALDRIEQAWIHASRLAQIKPLFC